MKKVIIIVTAIILLLVAALAGAVLAYSNSSEYESSVFPDKTYINGVDCSGLVMQALYAVGMQTPYNTYDHMFDPWQDHNAENMRADKKFKQISFSKRKRGDLIFYRGHVGIYIGNDMIINAVESGVQTQSVYSWAITGCSRVFI